MKRECRAISAVAMLDQHKRQGHSGVALKGLSRESSARVCVCVCLKVGVGV